MNKFQDNNTAEASGVIAGQFTFSHECNGEKFYKNYLEIPRNSGNIDVIPIMLSDRLVDMSKNFEGYSTTITGQFRSYNNHNGIKSTLELFLFAIEFSLGVEAEGVNFICLDGTICKEPVYRTTPSGRKIADILIAANRAYGKSDYIPCIVWGRSAKYASSLGVGTRINLEGRMQSRKYLKRLDDETLEVRTAYEVSVSRIEVMGSEDNE